MNDPSHETRDPNEVTIAQAIERFLASCEIPNSPKTVTTYRTALNSFCKMLRRDGVDPAQAPASGLGIGQVDDFIAFLAPVSPSTERLYLSALRVFFAFLEDEGLAAPNLGKIQRRIQKRSRKIQWTPDVFPREGIEKVIAYAQSMDEKSVENEGAALKSDVAIRAARRRARLRHLRDRALILVLADTGLRVAEACSLTFGQVDALEARLRDVRRKGFKRKGRSGGSVVRISERALAAVRDYQRLRREDPLPAGMKLKSVPLFVRHDPGGGQELKPLSEKSAWEIVKLRAAEAAGPEAAERIHPHSFRHYFVTVALLETDLETARRLAEHASADTTSLYAEIDPELDERYHKAFNKRG